eukprot:TRINITY_DN27444_c0_g1_i1.p1 TRINITY_DN27444_c0_g1~~TRINITY_DN27444_c0_g1_i1.p1  ORF type:complete len:642 (+),score=137.57 TRINITY_DN27444_c0_g1_i1:40-1965(+)
MDPTSILIVDIGGETVRAGLAGDRPSNVFLSYVVVETETGCAGLRCRDRGTVVDWGRLEGIWKEIFTTFGTDHPVLVVAPPTESPEALSRISEMLFETFNVPTICFGDSAVLSACSAGLKTGLILETGSGHSVASIVSEGKTEQPATVSTRVAGKDVTLGLSRMLNIQELPLPVLNNLKEMQCFVSKNPLMEVVPPYDVDIDTGGGNEKITVRLSNERYRASEVLFYPRQLLPDGSTMHVGLHELIASAAKRSKIDANILYSNILITGGNALLPGIIDRLENELIAQLPAGTDIRINIVEDPIIAAWRGGSILSLASDLPWRYKKEYDAAKALKAPRNVPDKELTHVNKAHSLTEDIRKLEVGILERNISAEKKAREEASDTIKRQQKQIEELEQRLGAVIVETGNWEARISHFLRYYDPDCLPSTTKLLQTPKYRSCPELLLSELIEMYGPEPTYSGTTTIQQNPYRTMEQLDNLRRRQPRKEVLKIIPLRPSEELGLKFLDLPPIYKSLGLGPAFDSVVVSEVDGNGIAAQFGIEIGDCIIAVDGDYCNTAQQAATLRDRFYFRNKWRNRDQPFEKESLILKLDTHDVVGAIRNTTVEKRAAAEAELAILKTRNPSGKSDVRSLAFRGSELIGGGKQRE